MRTFLSLFCLILLPSAVRAAPSAAKCANDPQSKIFAEYQSLSDDEIARRCFYDIEKIEPDASEARKKANPRRASICESGLNKMRDISERYVAKKKEVCGKALSAPTCAEETSQTSCVVDAAKLSAEVKKGEEELSELMREGKERLTKLTKFNRIRTDEFQADMATLGMLSREQKNKRVPRPQKINSYHRGPKPTPGQIDQPLAAPSEISTAAKPDPVAPVTRDSEISSNSGPRTPSQMRPQDYGANSLAEYEKKLPLLIRQHEETTKQLQRFEEVRVVKYTEHKAAASEMAAKAAHFFTAAEKLGFAGEELTEWKKENPQATKAAASPEMAVGKAAFAQEAAGEADALGQTEEMNPSAKEKISHAISSQTQTSTEGATAKADEPTEDPALASFKARLSDDAKNPAVIAERGRLRDLLKRRLQAQKEGQPVEDLEKVPGSFVGDILAESKAIMGRGLDSEGNRQSPTGPVDVEGALQDIEAQLRELDRQSGILESSSPSLFQRIKATLKKRAKEL